jgi:hypothetical protein
MPADEAGGKYWYDYETCDRWRRSNTAAKVHGGRRPGAGRKRNPVPPDRRIVSAVEIADARRRARERQSEFVHVADLLQVTHAELLAIVALEPEESGLDKAKLERLKLLQETRSKYREEQEHQGRLVDAEEAAAAFAARLMPVRERLDRLPSRVLRAVCAALEIDRARESAALDAMTAEVDAIVEEIGRDQGTEAPRH